MYVCTFGPSHIATHKSSCCATGPTLTFAKLYRLGNGSKVRKQSSNNDKKACQKRKKKENRWEATRWATWFRFDIEWNISTALKSIPATWAGWREKEIFTTSTDEHWLPRKKENTKKSGKKGAESCNRSCVVHRWGHSLALHIPVWKNVASTAGNSTTEGRNLRSFHTFCVGFTPLWQREEKKTPYLPRSKRHSSLISLSAARLIHSCARPLFSLQQRVENNNPIKRYHRCRGLSAPFPPSPQELQDVSDRFGVAVKNGERKTDSSDSWRWSCERNETIPLVPMIAGWLHTGNSRFMLLPVSSQFLTIDLNRSRSRLRSSRQCEGQELCWRRTGLKAVPETALYYFLVRDFLCVLSATINLCSIFILYRRPIFLVVIFITDASCSQFSSAGRTRGPKGSSVVLKFILSLFLP